MKTLLSIMPFLLMMGMLNAQTIIHVPADYPSIQAAVDAASDADTVLVADGTYTGDGNNSISLDGKAVVVKSANGPATCIMDGEGDGYFGFADSDLDGIAARVEGFTVRNFKGPGFYFYAGAGPDIIGNVIESCSGGIMVAGGDQSVIRNNIVQNNTASGMEISNYKGIVSSNIIRNNANENASGGGLQMYRSEAIVMNNLISDNAAKNHGGGIYAREDTSLYINNTITVNQSQFGAGMYAEESAPILINNIIAHSGLYLWPEEEKLVQIGTPVISYSYSGGVISGANISAAFANKGAACEVKVHVTGIASDSVFTAAPYEEFGLTIACGTGGYDFVNTKIASANDTLIIGAGGAVKLNPHAFSVTSHGLEEVPGAGLVASESEDIVLKNCLFFENEGGDFFKGNSADGLTEVDPDGVNGSLIADPLLDESTKVPLAGSPCIDKGTSDIEGVQLPESDVYGNERLVDGDNDSNSQVDIGACEYVYVPVVGLPGNKTGHDNTLKVFPNPVSRLARIAFSLTEASHVTLDLYDYLGRRVASLLNEQLPAGPHSLDFHPGTLSGGIYFLRLHSSTYSLQRKLILNR
jgi:parallel beta-helix repeat protein/predicted outer membrane repeat protein